MEAKLKSAYVNKERAAQIAEQEAMKTERMVRFMFPGRAYVLINTTTKCLAVHLR